MAVMVCRLTERSGKISFLGLSELIASKDSVYRGHQHYVFNIVAVLLLFIFFFNLEPF